MKWYELSEILLWAFSIGLMYLSIYVISIYALQQEYFISLRIYIFHHPKRNCRTFFESNLLKVHKILCEKNVGNFSYIANFEELLCKNLIISIVWSFCNILVAELQIYHDSCMAHYSNVIYCLFSGYSLIRHKIWPLFTIHYPVHSFYTLHFQNTLRVSAMRRVKKAANRRKNDFFRL